MIGVLRAGPGTSCDFEFPFGEKVVNEPCYVVAHVEALTALTTLP